MEIRDAVPFVLVILLAIGALFMIAAGGEIYGLGVALFVVAVVGGFWSVKRYFDRQEIARH